MSVEELALLVAACPAFKLADLDGSQPQPAAVVLPTVGEVVDIIKEGGFYSDTARAVLGLIAARLPVWQPVEPGTVIKAGTRVRRPVEHILPTDTPANDGWCIDPRTVPAGPVDHYRNDARDLLARLDAVGDDA